MSKFFDIKRVSTVVYQFRSDLPEDCGICRNKNIELCIECESDHNGGNECLIALGECGHSFHSHCIFKWNQKRPTCPLCGAEWNLAQMITH